MDYHKIEAFESEHNVSVILNETADHWVVSIDLGHEEITRQEFNPQSLISLGLKYDTWVLDTLSAVDFLLRLDPDEVLL